MAYVLLGAAIALGLVATTLLKYTEGFTKLFPTLGCIGLYILCFYCLSRSLLRLNLGIAYATWSGVGIIATTIISAVVFRQGVSAVGLVGIVLIVVGCILLNLYGNAH